jgi:pimeloyl-ACP methyl ester carboxylesterase
VTQLQKLAALLALAGCILVAGCATATVKPPAPVQTTWIEANHTSLRYELTGSGPSTVVLLHEMQMTLESWDGILPSLQPGRRILRYDLRGFGLSEKIRGAVSIEDEVEDLHALLDALHIQGPVTLIGGAVGGAVALKFAATYPAQVIAVAVTSPAAYMKPQPERVAAISGGADEPARASADRAMDAVYPPALRTDPARFARFRDIVLSTDPGSLVATTRMIYSTGFADVLPQIQCPTLVVATALFPRPVASFKELADALPKGQFVVLQTGHFASLESPELVAPVLLKFLKSVGG